eukprot:2586997-Alexandrium_andersonii.AAC.1
MVASRELPARMLRALQDALTPPPGLDLPDNRPGPRLQPIKEEHGDPYDELRLDFSEISPGAQPSTSLQRHTPPPPPPSPDTSQSPSTI